MRPNTSAVPTKLAAIQRALVEVVGRPMRTPPPQPVRDQVLQCQIGAMIAERKAIEAHTLRKSCQVNGDRLEREQHHEREVTWRETTPIINCERGRYAGRFCQHRRLLTLRDADWR